MIVYDPERTVPNWAPGSWGFLESILPLDAVCFEWGGGQSTKWLLDRVPDGYVYTVEHDKKWYGRTAELADWATNFMIFKHDKESPAYVAEVTRCEKRPNVYLIDGYQRPECLELTLDIALSGDIIVCDDALDFADVVDPAGARTIYKFAMPHPCAGTRYNKSFHRQGMHPDTKETWIWRA